MCSAQVSRNSGLPVSMRCAALPVAVAEAGVGSLMGGTGRYVR